MWHRLRFVFVVLSILAAMGAPIAVSAQPGVLLVEHNEVLLASTVWSTQFGYAPEAGDWTDFIRHPRMLGDVNADGDVDLVGCHDQGVFVALSNGSGFGPSSLWLNNFGYLPAAGGWTSYDTYPRALGDVNGDGKADMVGFGNAGVMVALSTGTSFAAPTYWLNNFGKNYSAGGWTSFDRYPRLLADVSGDGKADVVGFGNAGTLVAVSDGTKFVGPTVWINNFGYWNSAGGWLSFNRHPRTAGDVNGDGAADLVGFGNAGTLVALSSGSSFNPPTVWINNFGFTTAGGGWLSYDQYPRTVADVDGDGNSDIVGFGNAGVLVSISDGLKFGAAKLGVAQFGYSDAAGGWIGQYWFYPRFAGDVSGDGRADVVGCGHLGTYVSVSDW